jgi:hypothetical protein
VRVKAGPFCDQTKAVRRESINFRYEFHQESRYVYKERGVTALRSKKSLDLDRREVLEMHVPNPGSPIRIGRNCDHPQVILLSPLSSQMRERKCIKAVESRSVDPDGALGPM